MHHTSVCTESSSDKQESNKTTTTSFPSSAPSRPVQQLGQYHVSSSDLRLLKTAVATVSYVTRFWENDPNRTSAKIKLTPPMDSIILLVQTLSITQTTEGWF